MDAAYVVFQQALVLLIIVATGSFVRKIGLLSDAAISGINRLCLDLTMPCLLLMIFQKSVTRAEMLGFGQAVLASAACHIGSMALSWLIFARWKDKKQKPVLWMLSVLSNAAFLGMPLISAAYGDSGLLYSAAYILCFNLVLWTAGTLQFTGKISLRAFINPGFLSVIAGGILFIFQIRIPKVPADALNMLGSLTTPLSMLLVGARLLDVKPALMRSGATWLAAGVRLILMPALMLIGLRLAGLSGLTLAVPVVSAAMGSAATTTLFADRFGGDAALASCVIAVTTAICVITVPLFVLVISFL